MRPPTSGKCRNQNFEAYIKKKKKGGGMGEVRGWWWYSHDRANEINSPKHKANLVPQKMKCELHTTYIQQLHGSTDSTLF